MVHTRVKVEVVLDVLAHDQEQHDANVIAAVANLRTAVTNGEWQWLPQGVNITSVTEADRWPAENSGIQG